MYRSFFAALCALALQLATLGSAGAQAVQDTQPAASREPAVAETAATSEVAAPPPSTTTAQLLSAPGSARVPLPWTSTFRQLHEIEGREQVLWKERYRYGTGLPTAGIALGIPLTTMLIPWGTVLIVDSNRMDDIYSDDKYNYDYQRRTGALMLTAGIMALGVVVYSAWHLSHIRRRRAGIDSELRALGSARSALERSLEYSIASHPAFNAQ